MKTVTICGSMKFMQEMQRIAFLLETRENMNVLQCVYNVNNLDITLADQSALKNAHYRKIELSDAIYVVDIHGYVGNQTSDNPYMKQSVRKRAVNLQLENSEGQNLISESKKDKYMQAKAEGKIALANDGNIFGCTLDPSGQGIILTDIYNNLVNGILKIPSQGTIQDGRILNVTAVSPNLQEEILKSLEARNLIDEPKKSEYTQEKNANGLAVAFDGEGIFSGISDESGRYVITDYYHKVGPILKLPEKVITQNGYVLPVVGIGGEDFRNATFETIEINPLTKTFCFEGDAESAFFGNKNIKTVDCSKAISLEYLEIGDGAFEDSSLKSIVAPSQEVEIVTGKDAYARAPIEDYVSYLLSLDSQKTSGFWGFFKKASDTIIDKANHVLNKLKSIINFSCLDKLFMISELKYALTYITVTAAFFVSKVYHKIAGHKK